MKTILKTEELAQLSIAVYALYLQPIHIFWGLWIILFLAPDLGMLGYLINTKIGAIIYNLFHHKLIAILISAFGFFFANHILLLIGIILFAHSSFDRMMGYGLKYNDGFNHTHLGMVGKKD
ncbi:MAG: DUF4260 domain-containing protein [Bacteroidetes bacterium]|nr:DUF4260 domain-containing protein [Bacteroidota bacterium]MBU1484369.1 DUF4260 domain-containing protein [Bacteroidota bacterium]MBU2269492.1 DUF4260 domain-containing protein [Bacteroidota bacterium]MBU2374515.1 DUF4260 domain-containing protein [Bacteroidota bacterium]